MADSLDKFVLEYVVEIKDSVKRLEDLQKKIKKTGKDADTTKKSIKDVATQAIPGVNQVVQGFEQVSGMLKKIPPQAYVAVAAILAIAGAIKLVTANLKEYDAQRATSQKTGMSVLQVEDFQRKFSRGSGGRVGSESARGAIEVIAEKLKSAQVNPNMNNRDAIALRMAGASPRGPGGEMTSTTEAINQMMEKMRNSSEQVAVAMGTVNGLTIDQARALREYAIAQGKVSTLTMGEIQMRQRAEKGMESYRKSMGVVDEQLREARQTLADALIPVLEVFGELLATLATFVNKAVKKIVDIGQYLYDFYVNLWKNIKEAIKNPGDAGFADIMKKATEESERVAREEEDKRKKKATDKDMATYNKRDEAQQRQIIQQERAANLFSNAVMAFANAIDEREAWAAWAGMAGSASGLRGGGPGGAIAPPHPRFSETPVAGAGLSRSRTQSPGDIAASVSLAPNQSGGGLPAGKADKYRDLIEASSKKHGVPADLIAKVISGESKFNPNAVSEAGAQGLMQLMPEIQKSYGVSNAFDPAQNIDAGARLLAENLKRTKGDVDTALKMYHGGPNQKGWGRRTNQYPGYILGQNIGQNGAPSAKMNMSGATGSWGDAKPTRNGGASGSWGDPEPAKPVAVAAPKPAQADTQGVVRPASPTRTPGRFEAPSPSTMARDDIIRNIEAATGVPFAQIKQGGLSRGDMEKTMGEMYNGQMNHINAIKTKLEGIGMPATEVAKLQRELQTAQRNLETMQRVGSEVAGIGAEGGRQITFGANSVIISVNGAQNPYATAVATKEEFYKQTDSKSMVNQQSTSIKR